MKVCLHTGALAKGLESQSPDRQLLRPTSDRHPIPATSDRQPSHGGTPRGQKTANNDRKPLHPTSDRQPLRHSHIWSPANAWRAMHSNLVPVNASEYVSTVSWAKLKKKRKNEKYFRSWTESIGGVGGMRKRPPYSNLWLENNSSFWEFCFHRNRLTGVFSFIFSFFFFSAFFPSSFSLVRCPNSTYKKG